MVVLGKRKVDGDRVGAGAHFQRDAMALAQQAELLVVVVAKQIGARERGFKNAPDLRRIHRPACWPTEPRWWCAHAQRIKRPHRACRRLSGHKIVHGVAQVVHLLLVDALHLVRHWRESVWRVGQ